MTFRNNIQKSEDMRSQKSPRMYKSIQSEAIAVISNGVWECYYKLLSPMCLGDGRQRWSIIACLLWVYLNGRVQWIRSTYTNLQLYVSIPYHSQGFVAGEKRPWVHIQFVCVWGLLYLHISARYSAWFWRTIMSLWWWQVCIFFEEIVW